MPAPLRPLVCSVNSVASHFTGMEEALTAVAARAYPNTADDELSVARLLTSAIRAAMWKLENASNIPFFVTRYCTHELAAQGSLVMGTDFDEWMQPLSYRQDRWLKSAARTDLPKQFVGAVTAYNLTLENGAKIYDIDLQWLQINREKGVVYVLPSGLATAGLGYSGILAYGVFLRGGAGGEIPLLIHVRYTAGLVERTGTYADPDDTDTPFDPDADDGFNTQWDQDLCQSYQHYVNLLAASIVMDAVGAHLEKGGVQISLDGLSETVNGQALTLRSDAYEKEALAWATSLQQAIQGPIVVTL